MDALGDFLDKHYRNRRVLAVLMAYFMGTGTHTVRDASVMYHFLQQVRFDFAA